MMQRVQWIRFFRRTPALFFLAGVCALPWARANREPDAPSLPDFDRRGAPAEARALSAPTLGPEAAASVSSLAETCARAPSGF
jgi:hypothetical protein